jgi:hypothetical protein
MDCGFKLLTIIIGLGQLYAQREDSSKSNPPAWYHLPPDQSPYGPRIQNGEHRPDSSFVPIPSPFQLQKPKSPEEVAATQLVNAAQQVRLNKNSS